MHTEWTLVVEGPGKFMQVWNSRFQLGSSKVLQQGLKVRRTNHFVLNSSQYWQVASSSVCANRNQFLVDKRVRKKWKANKMLTYKHRTVDGESARHCKQTWKKEHDVPSDTSRVTCPSMSCTRPDFLTSIFPIWPSRRSFRLQQFSSACSSCCVWQYEKKCIKILEVLATEPKKIRNQLQCFFPFFNAFV